MIINRKVYKLGRLPNNMKTKKQEVQKYIRIIYLDKCEICGKEIQGFSPDGMRYNLKIHKEQKHKGNKK